MKNFANTITKFNISIQFSIFSSYVAVILLNIINKNGIYISTSNISKSVLIIDLRRLSIRNTFGTRIKINEHAEEMHTFARVIFFESKNFHRTLEHRGLLY